MEIYGKMEYSEVFEKEAKYLWNKLRITFVIERSESGAALEFSKIIW